MEIIGEYVDRLVTVEIRPRNFPQRGIIGPLYDKAREKAGRPLTLLAAEKIMANAKKDDNVFIVTGIARLPFLPHGETDGPLGAASLARAVSFGIGIKPILVVGTPDVESVSATVRAAGVNIEDYEVVRQTKHTGAMITFPCDDSKAEQSAKELIDKYNPKAIISIEVLGPNRKGVFHSAMAMRQNPDILPKYFRLFDEAKKRGILTISCIDCGNEVGSGTVAEEIRRVVPYGDVCQCPCGGGLACVTEADITIPAALQIALK